MYRSYGLRVVTIAEHFGETKVPDEVWIEWSARQGMIAVCKDDRIRYRYDEAEAIERAGARVLVLANRTLSVNEMVERFRQSLRHLPGLTRIAEPWIFGVYKGGDVRRLTMRRS